MDQTRATTDGDGLTKHDRKHSLDLKGHEHDHSEKEQDGGDPWVKVSAYSCTAGSTASNDSSCSPTKLPHVELITHDPGAQVLSTNDAARQLSNDANAARNGESVLKRLAVAASPSGALDAAPLNSGFQSVAQVSLRPEASANKSASGFEAVPQTSTRTEVAQTNTAQTVDKSGVPVIRASDLVVKESTPGVKTEPTPLATNTTVARDLNSPASGFQSVTQVALRTDGIVEKSGKVVSSEALVVTPIAPVTRAAYTPTVSTTEATTLPTPTKVENTAVTAAAPTSSNKSTSGFEAVPQTSTRTEVAQTNTAQTVDKSGVPVIKASDLVVKESTPGVKIEPTALATNTTLARDLNSPVAPAKDTAAVTSTLVAKDSNPTTARVESVTSTPTASNKVEVASTSPVSGFQSVSQVALRTDGIVEKSGKVVSSEALVVTPIAPVTRAAYTPTVSTTEATTSPTPTKVENTAVTAAAPTSSNKSTSGFEAVPQTSTRTEVAQTNTAQTVDKSGVPVIRASDLVVKESTPGVKIEPTVLATNTTVARDLSGAVAPAKDTAAVTSTLVAKDSNPTTARVESVTSTPTASNKVEVASTSPVSGFQSVSQVALRTDGIVEKSGKVVSSEALVVTPIAPVTRAVYTPTVSTTEATTSPTPTKVENTAVTAVAPTSSNKSTSGFEAVPQTSTRTEVAQTNTAQTVDKSGVPVIKASDLVVKESTPTVKIEPTVLATNTTVARDLNSPVAAAKDTAAVTSTLVAKDSNPTTARVESVTSTPTASNKVEVASTSQVSGFQSVTSASLRPDGVVEKSGKIVSSEALVVTPMAAVTRAVYTTTSLTPEATTATPTSASKSASGFEAVPQTSTRTEVAQATTTQAVDKSGVPVIKASDLVVKESTPTVKIEPTPLATNTSVVRDLTSTALATKDSGNATASNKVEVASSSPVSGFQSVTSASLRPDGVVEKSGKIVSSEALVVAPMAPVTRAIYTPTAVAPEASTTTATTRAETTATAPAVDKSGVPVIKASDLVVKEGTPGAKVETAPLATSTSVARDLNNTTAATKDTSNTAASNKTEIASSSTVSGFQSVTSASLRPDGVVEKSGKIVSSEALVVAPIVPVTRAIYTPTAVVPEASTTTTTTTTTTTATTRAETTATAPAVDKSGVPVIKASDLVVKEGTPGAKVETAPLATSTSVARDLNNTTAATKDSGNATNNNKVEVLSNSPVSAFQSVASASRRPDGIVDKNGKTISAESFAVAPIVPVTKASPALANSPAGASAGADTVSSTNQTSGSKAVSSIDSNPQFSIRTDAAMAMVTSAITSAVTKELTAKAEPTMRVLDNLQTAANSTAPKAIGAEHGQIGQVVQINHLNQLNQPATALSAALAAAINGRMLGHQSETTKPFTTGHGPAAMIDTSAVATTKGSIIGVAATAKTEPGAGLGIKGEGVAPAKTDAVSVSAEIKLPLGTKVKKSEPEEAEDDGKIATATSAKVFGAGGNGGSGTNSGAGTTNSANGQAIDPSVAGMIGGTTTSKPFDLPPLEITDKENENGRATKGSGSNNNAANNSGNKVNGGPTQKEMSDALQALIEKRRKERTRKPVTSTGKKTPVYKPEKQRRCLVLKGDTLESLAEQYLADGNLAELIYEINKGFWREKRRAGVVYLEFIPGSTIFLPTEEEIALFRRKKIASGKPYLSFKCAPPKAVRSLRQSVKQNQQQQEATVDLKLDLEQEQDTVVIAEAVPPTVFTANAPANSDNSIEKALAVQLIAHLAQVSDTSRVLQPNQAKQVRELEETSRVTVVGEQSAVDATAYIARIEVLCENVWQPVMEYIIDGALGDATLKIYSLGGKVREVNLDLPLSIIREMAFNDLTANRLNYCKKYLLGRKIFC